jgi:hypothetical protein
MEVLEETQQQALVRLMALMALGRVLAVLVLRAVQEQQRRVKPLLIMSIAMHIS